MRSVPFFFTALLLVIPLMAPSQALADGGSPGRIFSLWPLVDYRSSPEVDYRSLHLFGPLIKDEVKETEHEFALRPLWYRASDRRRDASLTEFLFPVYQRIHESDTTTSRTFGLIHNTSAPDESSFMLFPLVFYRQSDRRGNELALFPVGGHLENRFGRRTIDFALFPLYSRTTRPEETITHNLLWPIVSWKKGPDNETGWGVWPLYGHGRRDQAYRERFVLWPFCVLRDEYREGRYVPARRAYFPFYLYRNEPQLVEHTVLWPFFAYREDSRDGYREWDLPWPLVRVSRGEGKQANRFLPFYSDERFRNNHKRWVLWPIYKFEESDAADYHRRRHRVLFFLYGHSVETDPATDTVLRQHSAFWPLFSFIRHGEVRELRFLSLLDPIFPETPALERNWEPLWRLYARRWDSYGNSAVSVLWNLYWQERRGDDVARELFPLFDYRREGDKINFGILKGLIRYRHDNGRSRLSFFFF